MPVVKNPPASAGDARDVGLIPGLGRSPGIGNGNPLWYSCLENPMNREAWWATAHGITKNQTQVSTHALFIPSCLVDFYRSLHWHEWFGSEPMLFLQALKQPYPFQTILSLVWCSDLPVVSCHSWASLGSLSTQQRGFKFLLFFFIFKLYIIVLVLPNIKMNPPQVYMCSPSLLKSLQWFPIAHRLK